MRTRTAFEVVILTLAGAASTFASSCGTVGTPTSCSITVGLGGNTLFTITDFVFVNAFAGGARTPYAADDISIDLVTGGGITALLTFPKNLGGPSAGFDFRVNPGETEGFTFSYRVTASPNLPGTVALTDPVISDLTEGHANNAQASFQTAMSGAPPCLSFTGATHAVCSLPPGTGSFVNVGDILAINGNGGNTTVPSFQTQFTADFTPASATPEPSNFFILAAGLAWPLLRRLRRVPGIKRRHLVRLLPSGE